MTHTEARIRRSRVIGYCTAYPRATDAEVALALGLAEATVKKDRIQTGCTCRRAELRVTPAGRLLLGMIAQRPLLTLSIISRSGYGAGHVYETLRELASLGLARRTGRPAQWVATAAGRSMQQQAVA